MRKLVLLFLIAATIQVVKAQIATTVTGGVFCPGVSAPSAVSYTSSATTFQPNNVFSVQLSNAQGSFANPVTIGSLASSSPSGTIPVTVPLGTPYGTQYRMRIKSSEPVITGSNSVDLTIVSEVTIGTSNAICEGQAVGFSVLQLPGATYMWGGPNGFSGAVANPPAIIASQAAAGLYEVFVSVNGCSLYDTAQIVVNPIPPAPVIASNSPVCAGQTLVLSVTNPVAGGDYVWYTPGFGMGFGPTLTFTSVQSTPPDIYSVQAIVNGCYSAYATTYPSIQPTEFSLSTNSPVPLNGTIYIEAYPVLYPMLTEWTGPNGYSYTGYSVNIPNATAAYSGMYTATAIGNSCLVQNPVSVNVVVGDPGGIFTPASPTENALQVVPNPSSGKVLARLSKVLPAANVQLRVLNMLGQEMMRTVACQPTGALEIPLDLENQPAGIYLLQMQLGPEVYTQKLVLQR